MIRCYLSRMMGERKMKISDVSRATGLNRSTVSALYREDMVRIDVDALEKLCTLFECSVGELLEFVPVSDSSVAAPPAVLSQNVAE